MAEPRTAWDDFVDSIPRGECRDILEHGRSIRHHQPKQIAHVAANKAAA